MANSNNNDDQPLDGGTVLSDAAIQPHQFDVGKLYRKADEVINDMNPKPGWNIPYEDCTVSVQEIELKDGRTAQLQVRLTCDETEWV